ncbi:MAG TPA: thioredoxin [Candidatus Dormibacteraeota bacterium]|nr:thioredoxin [Candidatus Dormibacteraeota bacterium]
MAEPVQISDETFATEVLQSDKPVLVDFWAEWCGPCKMLSPIVVDLAREYDDRMKVAQLDVDANPVTAGQFGVMSIPTLILFKGGSEAQRLVGYQPKPALKAKLDAVI